MIKQYATSYNLLYLFSTHSQMLTVQLLERLEDSSSLYQIERQLQKLGHSFSSLLNCCLLVLDWIVMMMQTSLLSFHLALV